MERHILLAFLHFLIVFGGVAIADRNPSENNVALQIPAERELPTVNQVSEEGLVVAIQSVIQAMEDKFTRIENQMNEIREEFKNDIGKISIGIEAASASALEKCLSAQERIKSEIKEEIKAQVDTLESRDREELGKQLDNATCPTVTSHDTGPLPSNCAEVKYQGYTTSGVYTVSLPDGKRIQVYCDMTTDGGGWTVIQRRVDITPHVDFNRGWSDYKYGFGDLQREFWLGLDNIHGLSSSAPVRLRVDLEDWKSEKRFAEYETFKIGDESDRFRLTVSEYHRGTAGDSMTDMSGYPFTTKDVDNDEASGRNCAQTFPGAWWYRQSCNFNSFLNGQYLGRSSRHSQGIFWYSWHGYEYSFRITEMKIRPKDWKL